jgi:putative membrane protein insertion efficiency factor
VKRLLTALLIAPIRLYQRWISPVLGPRCRYYPSCSDYAIQAIRELGPIRGLILAAWRLLRCNPFSHGGFDEVSDRRLFRNTPGRIDRTASPSTAARHTPAAPTGGSSRPNLT